MRSRRQRGPVAFAPRPAPPREARPPRATRGGGGPGGDDGGRGVGRDGDGEAGAREGAQFIREHIIRVTDKQFDDFAASGVDAAMNKELLGI